MDVNKLEGLIGKPPDRRRRPEGFGITVPEYMKLYGCGRTVARNMLESGVEKGMEKEEMLVHDGRVVVYYFPEN